MNIMCLDRTEAEFCVMLEYFFPPRSWKTNPSYLLLCKQVTINDSYLVCKNFKRVFVYFCFHNIFLPLFQKARVFEKQNIAINWFLTWAMQLLPSYNKLVLLKVAMDFILFMDVIVNGSEYKRIPPFIDVLKCSFICVEIVHHFPWTVTHYLVLVKVD